MENELPKRKPTRLFGFDYSTPGAYFITICTQNRKNVLSTIVGEGSPLPQLTHVGRLVDGVIQALPQKFPQAAVDCYVIMPNHLHLMLSIRSDNGRGNPSPTVNMIIGWLKYESTKRFNQSQKNSGEHLFQRSFHDHIVRNYDDYGEICQYIHDNPARWHSDTFYTKE